MIFNALNSFDMHRKEHVAWVDPTIGMTFMFHDDEGHAAKQKQLEKIMYEIR
jgi:hypothetical protein